MTHYSCVCRIFLGLVGGCLLVVRASGEVPPSVHSDSSDPKTEARSDASIDQLLIAGHLSEACIRIDKEVAVGNASLEQAFQLIERRGVPAIFQTSHPDTVKPRSMTPLMTARRALTKGRYANAEQSLSGTFHDHWPDDEHAALFGRLLAKRQDFQRIPAWLKTCDSSVVNQADYWTATAAFHANQGEWDSAVGATLQALEIDPTSADDLRSLQVYLRGDEHAELRKAADNRYRLVAQSHLIARRIVTRDLPNKPPNPSAIADLAPQLSQLCLKLTRPLEALKWESIGLLALESTTSDESERARLAGVRRTRELILNRQRLALKANQTLEKMAERMRRFDQPPGRYPTPTLNELQTRFRGSPLLFPAGQESKAPPVESEFAFVETAATEGLTFQYENRTPIVLKQFRLHETLGGGIGVLDYDCDGLMDIYLVQGGGNPPAQLGLNCDQLFRNGDRRWNNVTEVTVGNETAYGLGITAGDLNEDGFADLVVGNLGINRVLINQGDGTFTDRSRQWDLGPGLMTTGLAIADVTGDSISDLIETNYINDQAVFRDRPAMSRGVPAGLSPNEFSMAIDRVYIQRANGTCMIEDLEPTPDPKMPIETGPQSSLGLVVTNLDHQIGNEIFIANDARPNRYWTRVATDESVVDGLGSLVDMATIIGVARDSTGAATAGMGVAVADFNRDGRADLHVTNFSGESSSLFIQSRSGGFVDQSSRLGLDASTLGRVDFGTQVADFNHDGIPDFVGIGGHIEDYSVIGEPFRMKPQMFSGFRLVKDISPTAYWDRPGSRAIACQSGFRQRRTNRFDRWAP